MAHLLRIAQWNANGILNHRYEIENFLLINKIDILLISESHIHDSAQLKVPFYTVYNAAHPDAERNPRGGATVIIRRNLKHHQLKSIEEADIQAATVIIEDWIGPLAVSAVYCPPNYRPNKNAFINLFRLLGNRFLAGGDYNAKHLNWGSRLSPPGRGRILNEVIHEMHLDILSTFKPTYWPTDNNRIPDLLDFFVVKGIPREHLCIKSSEDLASDHTPIIAAVTTVPQNKTLPPRLTNKLTNWNYFQEEIEKNLNLKMALKKPEDIEIAVETFTKIIQEAAYSASPWQNTHNKVHRKCPSSIRAVILEKRRLRRVWQQTRHPDDKTRYNRKCRELKDLNKKIKNEYFEHFLENLTPTIDTNYSLWKATRNLKRPRQQASPIKTEEGKWLRSDQEKADAFAEHLERVFQPIITNDNNDHNLQELLNIPHQMSSPPKLATPSEIYKTIVHNMKLKKAPGYDMITTEILRHLPRKGIVMLTQIINAILKLGYFPTQWKLAEIIMIAKPGKPATEIKSYRPISLLPVMSKIAEKVIASRLQAEIANKRLLPEHQFGFRSKYSTTEQIHRIVNTIQETFQEKSYCNAVFLDISQAFDRVWHPGLLFKLKNNIPHSLYVILESYLKERLFFVRYQEALTNLHPIAAGVPQGSVLGPILYSLFTADFPQSQNVLTATYADDTAILVKNKNPILATECLQNNLQEIQEWTNRWRIKINEEKSVNVVFTKCHDDTPEVYINEKHIIKSDSVKYLGLHIDKRLTWKKHITTKRKQMDIKFREHYWILGRKSQLSLSNKLLVYNTIFKPVWTYGIELWGTASNTTINFIERFQTKVLRVITNSPWFIRNKDIYRDLNVPTVKQVIVECSEKYLKRLEVHPNVLAINLLDNSEEINRLPLITPLSLPYRQ